MTFTRDKKDEVALMAANNATVSRISRETRLHHSTVKSILAEPATVQQVEKYTQVLGEKMLDRATEIIDTIDSTVIEKTGLRDRIVSAGILFDKVQRAYNLDKPEISTAVQVNIITDSSELRALLGGK
jgi:patatin-like phospholipase/acyl hydrolase